jgi:hypothetical protein
MRQSNQGLRLAAELRVVPCGCLWVGAMQSCRSHLTHTACCQPPGFGLQTATAAKRRNSTPPGWQRRRRGRRLQGRAAGTRCIEGPRRAPFATRSFQSRVGGHTGRLLAAGWGSCVWLSGAVWLVGVHSQGAQLDSCSFGCPALHGLLLTCRGHWQQRLQQRQR